MNCKGCWNYKNCENRNNQQLVICFKKNESICHYCLKETTCQNASNSMCICSEIRRKKYAGT